MTQASRKVNKPRTTLRKYGRQRRLHDSYCGVVPMLLRFGADKKLFWKYTPEQLLQQIALYMSGGDVTYLGLNKTQLTQFRRYLKHHQIVDWTRRGDESAERKEAARPARSRKAK